MNCNTLFEYRAIVSRQEVNRLTKAKDHAEGKGGQFDLVNFTNRLKSFARDGWNVKFSNSTYTEGGKIVIYALLQRELEDTAVNDTDTEVVEDDE